MKEYYILFYKQKKSSIHHNYIMSYSFFVNPEVHFLRILNVKGAISKMTMINRGQVT